MKRILMTIGIVLAVPAAAEPAALNAAPTLAQALERAWERAPVARALPARREQAAAGAQAAAAWTPAPPTVSLATLNDRLSERRGRSEWEAEVSVPLWLPRQREAQRALADADAQRGDAAAAAARLRLAGELRGAWWALAAARDRAALASTRLEAARALQADVDRRFRAGELARTDANVALAELRAQEGEIADARRAEQAAHDALQGLTGAPAPDVLAAEAATDASVAAPHPELAAAESALRSARSRLELAERSARAAPEVALRLLRERDDSGMRAVQAAGVRLSVPLASPPRLLRETAAQRAEIAEAQTQAERVRERLALDIAAARREIAAAELQGATGAERAALAADTLQLVQKSFALGESDLATLLRARAAAFDAQADVRRQATARAAAQSRINQALGVLP